MTDLPKEVCWRENPQTDGEENPPLHTIPPVIVFQQLFTDLTIDLIPAQRENQKNEKSR